MLVQGIVICVLLVVALGALYLFNKEGDIPEQVFAPMPPVKPLRESTDVEFKEKRKPVSQPVFAAPYTARPSPTKSSPRAVYQPEESYDDSHYDTVSPLGGIVAAAAVIAVAEVAYEVYSSPSVDTSASYDYSSPTSSSSSSWSGDSSSSSSDSSSSYSSD